ncbi:hypothetical protein E2C01_058316 [Portunus trituberculatus]|uniref:Uncharacterized protein n=1 Tax=Portunus trituberculatus TaxID=210409 RepID=A0A5B7H3E4_PORTR|nr:hypothetical protein [Portunus trituberculatus]
MLILSHFNLLSTMTRFHIHSAYYLVMCIYTASKTYVGESKIVKTVAINLLTSIDPS